MAVMLTRDWKGYKAGRVIAPGDGVANVLIRRGIAKAVVLEETKADKPKKAAKK